VYLRINRVKKRGINRYIIKREGNKFNYFLVNNSQKVINCIKGVD